MQRKIEQGLLLLGVHLTLWCCGLLDLRLHQSLDQVILKLLLILGNRCVHDLLIISDARLHLLDEHRHYLIAHVLIGQ